MTYKTFDQFMNESQSASNIIFVEDLPESERHRYVGSDVNNKDKDFVGIAFFNSSKYDERDIFVGDSYDKNMYGANTYRYETHMTRVAKMRPVIKIKAKTGMVYFMTEKSLEEDGKDFETKGVKLRTLVIFDKKKFLANQ